ncbi:unnamed protein product, partial [Mesorhabditis belari]|uniref:Uncharacterized protein n=1 Tax=Mesorhabditis belari TaxID=2138241 RepID=A0AAF3F6Z4_9BILA
MSISKKSTPLTRTPIETAPTTATPTALKATLSKEHADDAPENDEENDMKTDELTDIEVHYDEETTERKTEATLSVFQQQLPTACFWDTYMQSIIVKMGFFNNFDTIGAMSFLFMRYGPAIVTPLLVMTLVLGLPAVMLELWLGQFTSLDPTFLYERMVPAFGGIGYMVLLVNTATLCLQLRRAVVYISLFFEAISPGSTQNLYQSCHMDFNSQQCTTAFRDCPIERPILVENICTSNITYKANWVQELRNESDFQMPFSFPLYQFMFRNVLGEEEGMEVDAKQISGITSYCFVWILVLFIMAKGGTRLVKWVAIIASVTQIAFSLAATIVNEFLMQPMWYNNTEIASLDSNSTMDTIFVSDFGQMWIDASLHILLTLGLGDGAMVAFGANHKFNSFILGNALTAILAWGAFSIFFSWSFARAAIKTIYESVVQSASYTPGHSKFINAYNASVTNIPRPAAFFIVILRTQVSNEYMDGLLTLFTVSDFFLVMLNVMIRLKIIMGALSERLIGLRRLVQKTRFCIVGCACFGLMFILMHRYSLIWEAYFIEFSLVLLSVVVLIGEVLICYTYGVRRIFSNMCATQITWGLVARYDRLISILEYINILTIASWIILPPSLLTLGIMHTVKKPNFPDKELWKAKLVTAAFCLPPVVVFITSLWKTRKMKWTFQFKPDRIMWRPRTFENKELVKHVEKEYRNHS